jgi:hypothetical protein
MKLSICIAVIFLVSAANVTAGSAPICTPAQARAAEEGIGSLRSWADFQQAFRTFGHCDDGAISEGYSDFTMRMFAHHWSDVGALAGLVASDSKFRAFVFRHIDETWVDAEFDLTVQNATIRCPEAARTICADILARARRLPDDEGAK